MGKVPVAVNAVGALIRSELQLDAVIVLFDLLLRSQPEPALKGLIL